MNDSALPGIISRPVGQREPLTVRLASLIRGYPKGLGIIKEFLQNADDARASYLHIYVDLRSHNTSRLPNERYKALCGPALLFANDGVFSDDDFRGIQEIGQSVKRNAPAKIGKFGLGFNAAYNVSDFPTFLSRDRVCLFDPHCDIVAEGADDPGIEFTLTEELWRVYGDLLTPFTVAGLAVGSTSHAATVFRLPIRDAARAASSEISSEPFTTADLTDILGQLKNAAGELLLFLRHVQSLRVTVIKTGEPERKLLDVSTLNCEEVSAGRMVVGHWLSKAPTTTGIIAELRSDTDTPTAATFRHSIRIEEGRRSIAEAWLVTNGLYRGTTNALLDLAESMATDDERALPVAGAAARIETTAAGETIVRTVAGRAYCGLPLPRSTGLKIHINGFFELSDTRDWLKLDEDSVGKRETQRRLWNHELLSSGVAAAIAHLLAELVTVASASTAAELYGLWPDQCVLPGLTSAVYSHLWESQLSLIQTDDVTRERVAPHLITTLPTEWLAQLREPLSLAGRKLPNPELPDHVTAGFIAARYTLPVLSPKQLRAEWRQRKDVNCRIEEASNPAWRNRSWVAALLRYCMSDTTRDINGLPLAIAWDGRLHTFGINTLFLATDAQRGLLSAHQEWFIEPQLAVECRLTEDVSAKLCEMTPATVLARVKTQLSGPTIDWVPGGNAVPNEKWLTNLFEYIAETKCLTDDFCYHRFLELAVIPDQFGRLHSAGMTTTPLWKPQRGSGATIDQAMKAFRVPLVTASKPLLKSIKRAVATIQRVIIWDVTATDLIDVLDATQESWAAEARQYSPDVHDRLLDYFGSEDLSELTDTATSKLSKLPIFLTRQNVLVSAIQPNVVLPSEARLPLPPGQKLFFKAPTSAVRGLLRTAKAVELSARDVVEAIITTGLASLSESKRIETLTWLRENLELMLTPLAPAEADDLQYRLSQALLFQSDADDFRSAASLYLPSVTVAKEVLGPTAAFLRLERGMEEHSTLWLAFCQRLGVASSLRPHDLIAYIDRLIERARSEGTASVGEKLLTVFKHVCDNWSTLQKSAHEESNMSLANELSERHWLPAQQREQKLARYAAFTVPEDRLYAPHELYTPNLGHLVSSQEPLAPFTTPPKEILTALGFPGEPSIHTILKHFTCIIGAWGRDHATRPSRDTMTKSLGEIYRAIGNRYPLDEEAADGGSSNAVDLLNNVTLTGMRTRFAAVRCLWDDRKEELWSPECAFRNTGAFGHRRARLEISDSAVDRAYSVLGRRDTPDVNSICDLLLEIEDESDGAALEEQDLAVALEALSLLDPTSPLFPERAANLSLVTNEKRLVHYSEVYDDDVGVQMSDIRAGEVHTVHPGVPHSIRRALQLKSLQAALSLELVMEPRLSSDPDAQRLCIGLERVLHSMEFAEGLRRFAHHRKPEAGILDTRFLSTMHLQVVEKFDTIIVFTDANGRRDVGSGASSSFFCFETRQLKISVEAYDLAALLLVDEIERSAGLGPLANLSPLLEALRSVPSRISSVLDRLSIRVMPVDSDLYELAIQEHEFTPMSFPSEEVETYDNSYDADYSVTPENEESHIDDLSRDVDDIGGPPFALLRERLGLPYEASTSETDSSYSVYADVQTPETRPTGIDEKQSSFTDDASLRNTPKFALQDEISGPDASAGSLCASLDAPVRPSRSSSERGAFERVRSGGIPDPEARQRGPRERPLPTLSDGQRPNSSRDAFGRGSDVDVTRRIVTYISPARDAAGRSEGESAADEESATMEIGRAAESYVYETEVESGRAAERMPHNNPGFDILSCGENVDDLRYIEVKGVRGEWDAAGVRLSAQQFTLAWKERDKFWLYVVEFAMDPVRRRVTRVCDPASQVTEYRVDSGWRALDFDGRAVSYSAERRSDTPAVGDLMQLSDGRTGLVVALQGVGMLIRITLEYVGNAREALLYRPDQMFVIQTRGV